MQGRSFSALLRDPSQPFRESVYTRFGKGDAVVTERFLYTSYGADGEMLYDLVRDPGENTKLASKPEHQPTLSALRATLSAHQKSAAAAQVSPPRVQPKKQSGAAKTPK